MKRIFFLIILTSNIQASNYDSTSCECSDGEYNNETTTYVHDYQSPKWKGIDSAVNYVEFQTCDAIKTIIYNNPYGCNDNGTHCNFHMDYEITSRSCELNPCTNGIPDENGICTGDEPICEEPTNPAPACPEGSQCTSWELVTDTNTLTCTSDVNTTSVKEEYGSACKEYERCKITPIIIPPDDTNGTDPDDTNNTNPDGGDGGGGDGGGDGGDGGGGGGADDTDDDTDDTTDDTDDTTDDTDDECPDTFRCVASAEDANGIITNLYRVVDCNGVDYADREVVEATACTTPIDGTEDDSDDPSVYCPKAGLTLGINESWGVDCIRNCVSGTKRDELGICTQDEEAEDDCTNKPTFNGYPFQTTTYTSIECKLLINKYGKGNGYIELLQHCSTHNYNCYYSNYTPDINGSSTDTNSTTPFDDTNLLNRLDVLDSDINNQTTTLADKLDTLTETTRQVNDNTRKAVDNMSNDLGNKLDAIKGAIEGIPTTPATDMSETNQHLQNLEDNLNSDEGIPDEDSYPDSDIGTTETMNNFKEGIVNSTNSMQSALNGYISSFVGNAPTVVGSGTHVFTASVFGGSVSFDLSLFAQMRQYFDILWTLLLAYLNFKIYSVIIRDLLKKI